MQDDNAVQYCNINEITAVQFNFETNEILTTLIKFPMAPQYLSSRAETICNNIVHVFGGYMAQESRITAKPDISSTLFAFDLDKLVYLSKTANSKHATAGHNMFVLDSSIILICGGTKKEIILFSKLVPQADLCDLGEQNQCKINVSNVIYPIPWVTCEGLCKIWIHQFCTGLNEMPKGKFICSNCKTGKKK